jgi:gas vesicle protein
MATTSNRYGVEYVLGMLIGVGWGVAIGLMVAPASGRDSREWILARGRIVKSRTAAFLKRHDAMSIVRRRGVLGLADILRTRDRSA